MILALALSMVGCAAAKPRAAMPVKRFWRDCQETLPAKPDGFQHFTCTDMTDRRWRVLIQLEKK
jgi:hypothetical protein